MCNNRFSLCLNCLAVGFCRRWEAVRDKELDDPAFIVDVRNSAHVWMRENDVAPGGLIDALLNALSRHHGDFRDIHGNVDALAWELFEVPADDLFDHSDKASKTRANILDWIEYQFARSWPNNATAYLLDPVSRERFRTIASAVRVLAWDKANTPLWGVRPANDN